MADADSRNRNPADWPLAAIAAWVLPGLGHYFIGDKTRGFVIGATILTLYLGGLLIGGINVVDRREDTLWFIGQMLAGPITIAADQYHQHLKGRLDRQMRDHTDDMPRGGYPEGERSMSPTLHLLSGVQEQPVYRVSIGRVNELGTLYCTLAGVLNLLAILDVIGRAAYTGDAAAQGRGHVVTREPGGPRGASPA